MGKRLTVTLSLAHCVRQELWRDRLSCVKRTLLATNVLENVIFVYLGRKRRLVEIFAVSVSPGVRRLALLRVFWLSDALTVLG